MRGSLLHPIGVRRRAQRIRGEHPSAHASEHLAPPPSEVAPPPPDIAAQRVRESGGPTDLACYACQCGYVFTAAVSTTVECPHCGTPQAW
ncbi:MAG: hypothetical protein ABSH36_05410 [Solirubrobacteraceae bacterium]